MRVRLSAAAEADLAAIFAFTLARWGEAQAEAYLAGLHERLRSATPPPVQDARGLARIRCRSHNLFVSRADDGLLIVRVLHVRMDDRSRVP